VHASLSLLAKRRQARAANKTTRAPGFLARWPPPGAKHTTSERAANIEASHLRTQMTQANPKALSETPNTSTMTPPRSRANHGGPLVSTGVCQVNGLTRFSPVLLAFRA